MKSESLSALQKQIEEAQAWLKLQEEQSQASEQSTLEDDFSADSSALLSELHDKAQQTSAMQSKLEQQKEDLEVILGETAGLQQEVVEIEASDARAETAAQLNEARSELFRLRPELYLVHLDDRIPKAQAELSEIVLQTDWKRQRAEERSALAESLPDLEPLEAAFEK